MMARRAVLAIVLIAIVLLAGGLAYFAYLASIAPSSDAPTVATTSPLYAATGIGINTKILVTFSKSMDTTTLNTGTFSLAHGTTATTGTVTFTSLTETFAPAANLASNTVYTATVTTGAKDSSGNRLAVNYVWSFTTSNLADTTRPTVVGTYPIGSGAPLNSTISATFSKAMLPSTITSSSFFVNANKTSVAVSGTVTYAGNTASFKPTNNLASNTNYTATVTTAVTDLAGNALLSQFKWSFSTSTSGGICAQAPVQLNSAANFGVLGFTTVTNTGNTVVTNGDVGLSTGTSITGFPPGMATGTTSPGGTQAKVHTANDPASQAAQADTLTAYNDAVARTLCVQTVTGNIGNMTLAPGLYNSQSVLEISSGNLTLDAKNNANAVWIFQTGSTFTVSSGLKIILANGAQAKNIFWAIGSSATLNTNCIFYGTILAKVSITLDTGATLNGRALALGAAVTLQGNAITVT
jgi:hypothetical protein